MSDLVLMPMTRKEFLNLDMGLRGRILERQSTLYLINESKDTKFRTELDAAKAREAKLREALESCFNRGSWGLLVCPRCGNDTRRHAADCIVGQALEGK